MAKLGDRKRWKMQRYLLVELPGLGKPGAMERRPYPPGQHGQGRRKFSEFGLRLREKQKLLFHYCLREEQLRRMVRKAKSGRNSDWMSTLIGHLESRIDNLVFRLGLAPSILAARQLVLHGHIRLNGKKVTISSQEASIGAKISLSERAAKNPMYLQSLQVPRLQLAEYLGTQGQAENFMGTLKSMPTSDDIPFPFEKGFVAEFYSKV